VNLTASDSGVRPMRLITELFMTIMVATAMGMIIAWAMSLN